MEGPLTSFARQCIHPLSIEFLIVCNISELLPTSAEAQLVSFSHPLRFPLAEDMQESRLGEFRCTFRMKRKESIDGVRVCLYRCYNSFINDMMCRCVWELQRWPEDSLIVLKAESKLRCAQKEHEYGGQHGG